MTRQCLAYWGMAGTVRRGKPSLAQLWRGLAGQAMRGKRCCGEFWRVFDWQEWYGQVWSVRVSYGAAWIELAGKAMLGQSWRGQAGN